MSIEEKVEEYYKNKLKELNIRYYGKTETINKAISDALKNADSKSGNSGTNYPVKEVEEIDWNYMEKYIRAMEKVVIADVVKYKDQVIETTKRIVEK